MTLRWAEPCLTSENRPHPEPWPERLPEGSAALGENGNQPSGLLEGSGLRTRHGRKLCPYVDLPERFHRSFCKLLKTSLMINHNFKQVLRRSGGWTIAATIVFIRFCKLCVPMFALTSVFIVVFVSFLATCHHYVHFHRSFCNGFAT